MTALRDAFPLPAVYINKYIWESFKSIDDTLENDYGELTPFFPLADSRGGDAGWGNKPYVVYDELFRFRTNVFYGVHKVHIYYYVRGPAVDVLTWSNAIMSIMDRSDSSAVDVNNFIRDNYPDAGIFFHRTKAFQINPVSDQRMDLAVRQYYTAELLIECDYHLIQDQNFK